MEDLQDLINGSILSDELKAAYNKVLPEMTEEEKNELRKIIKEGNAAKAKHDEERLEKLARLNTALEKHLQDVSHKEEKYIRDEFEKFDNEQDAEEMQTLEQTINNL